jgi:hypothetical protein
MSPGLLRPALGDTEFCELGRDILAMRGRTDLLVDVQDSSVRADVKRPARGERLIFVDDAVRGCNLFGGIAQQRIVDTQRLRERLIGFRCIDADREMRDVEFSDRIAALTERLALGRSPTGEGFGEPRQHDGLLALVIGQAVGTAVRAGECKGRRRVANS